jgi:hypothetical protein
LYLLQFHANGLSGKLASGKMNSTADKVCTMGLVVMIIMVAKLLIVSW